MNRATCQGGFALEYYKYYLVHGIKEKWYTNNTWTVYASQKNYKKKYKTIKKSSFLLHFYSIFGTLGHSFATLHAGFLSFFPSSFLLSTATSFCR
ncbi:hypothetical protein K501DRAFT_64619 [Backusella circina FSU 941]|nr:hypothetical protein K501DRAFT_64619 [Backusella circina FSU 941]